MDADASRRSGSGFAGLLLPLLRGWKLVLSVLVVVWVVMVAVALWRGREYRAEVQLSTVSSQRALPASAGIAASLLGGGGAGGGVQLTPGLVVRIARMEGLLYRLGTRDLDGRPIADRLAGKEVADPHVVRTLREYLTAQFDIQTGVITLAVVHRDTGLARTVLGDVIREVSAAYRDAARAQAREIREAQQVRVDSAEHRLRAAEESLAAFIGRNRAVNEYTPEYVQMQALMREVETANTMYTQALSDRDMARGKELEDTPAVVLLSGPPDNLPQEPRGLGLRLVMVTLALVAVLWVLLVGVDALRWRVAAPTAAEAEAWQAALQIPMLGWILRLLVKPGAAR